MVRAVGADRVVLGLPLDPEGHEGDATRRARAFGDRLAAHLALPVELIDESFSTVEAEEVLLAADLSRQRAARSSTSWRRRSSCSAGWTAAPPRRTSRETRHAPRVLGVPRHHLSGLLVFAVAAYQIWTFPDRAAGPTRGNMQITIPRGATAQDVAALLEDAGLIKNPLLFRLYAVQRGAASRIRPGHYQVRAPITPKELVDTLVRGVADKLIAITIPEGKTFVEIADLLDAAGITRKTDFISAAVNANFIRTLDLPGPSLEGYLYPDTYRFRPRTPAAEVAGHMVRRHKQVYEEVRAQHAAGLDKLRQQPGLRGPARRHPGLHRREGDRPGRGAPAHRPGVPEPPHQARLHSPHPAGRSHHHLWLHGGPAGAGHAPRPPARSSRTTTSRRIHLERSRQRVQHLHSTRVCRPAPSPTLAGPRWPR